MLQKEDGMYEGRVFFPSKKEGTLQKLDVIDQQIAELKKKKEALRQKAAESFFKKCEKILGENFSTEIALGMIATASQKMSDTDKEVWQKAAKPFLGSSLKKASKAA